MNGTLWTKRQLAALRRLYANTATSDIALVIGRNVHSVYNMAHKLRLKKSARFLAMQASQQADILRRAGVAYRFQPGQVPANKGVRHPPGWSPGRMAETQFKRGQISSRWAPEDYLVGTLRLNVDGWVDMKVHEGPRAWKQFHHILWEDAHGPVPRGYVVRFKDGDKFNIELDNLHLQSRAQVMRENTIHNLPVPLKRAIQVLGQLKRRINENHRGSARTSVRNAGRPAR